MKNPRKPSQKTIDRIFDLCNLEGEDCEIYNVMYRFKSVRNLPEQEFEELYDDLAFRLGFMR